MMCQSIGELAQLASGRLRLATLPPIGGLCEPIRRIQTEFGSVQPGDVYWPVTQSVEPIDHAYARGALGVVSEAGPVEPWAGRFSLHVDSAAQSLQLAAERAGKQYSGHLVAVECEEREFVERAVIGLRHALPACAVSFLNSEIELARAIIHLDEQRPISVFTFYRQANDQSSDWHRRLAEDSDGATLLKCRCHRSLAEAIALLTELAETTTQREPCKALPSMLSLREFDMPTLLGRSDNLADRWHLGRPPWQVLPGRA